MASLPEQTDHYSAKERAEFIAGMLRRMFAMREENNSLGINFVSSLLGELNLGKQATAGVQLNKPDQSASNSGIRQPLLASIWQMFKVARSTLRRASGKSSILVLGIDPVRICWEHKVSFLDTVRSHLHPDLERVHEWLAKPEQDAECAVVAFEPKNSIRQLESIGYLANAISNPFSIILAGLLRLPSWSPTFFFHTARRLWRELESLTPSYLSRLKATLALSVFVMGCDVLLRKASEVRMLCMTSNSVFLELFRFMVIESRRGDVIEILHGILTPSVDEYFTDLGCRSASWGGGGLQIYPLMPPPLCRPAQLQDGIEWMELASNTGILRALNSVLDRPVDKMSRGSPEFCERIAEQIYSAVQHVLQNEKFTFAIFGGRDHDDDYYGGETFALEMHLAMGLRNQLASQGFDTATIYLPHPSNQPLDKVFFADGEELTLFKSTQLSYFFADFGLSIYSSAMFEAAFFGADCFTPVVGELGLFPGNYMSLLTTPEGLSREDVEGAIMKLAASKARTKSDHKDTILRRVEMFFGNHG